MKKVLLFICLSILFYTLPGCKNYPDNINNLAQIVQDAVREKEVDAVWNIYINNPAVRKYILVNLYRNGRITKFVMQKEMGRVLYLKNKEKKKLLKDFKRILTLLKNFKINTSKLEIKKIDKKKKYFLLVFGKKNNYLKINVHYEHRDNNYFIVSIYNVN